MEGIDITATVNGEEILALMRQWNESVRRLAEDRDALIERLEAMTHERNVMRMKVRELTRQLEGREI